MNCNGNRVNAEVSNPACCLHDWAQEPAHHLQGPTLRLHQGTGSRGTMQAGNHFLTESDPGARGLLAFLKSPKQCFSETCIRNEDYLDNPAVSKAPWQFQGSASLPWGCPHAHTEKTFPPTPNTSLTHIWSLYYTGMYTELQDSCTVFWTQIWVAYFPWILSNCSLQRNFLGLPLHINACMVIENPGV